jgi:hypothetical protein
MAYIYEDKSTDIQKDEMKKSLEKMEKSIQNGKEIEEELAAVWEKIRLDAFSNCPMDTGSLASTIRVIKTSLGNMVGGNSSIKSITLFDRTIVAGDYMTINPKTNKPVDYASFVHDGYTKGGYVNNGTPFLTNALAKYNAELDAAIERALVKLGKDFEEGGKN